MSDAAPVRLIVEQVASRERTVRARMQGYNQRALVHFGDTNTAPIDPNRSVLHTYDRIGPYTCTLTTQFKTRPWPPPKIDILATAPAIILNGLGPVFTVTPSDKFQQEQNMTLTMEDHGLGIATFGEIRWPVPPNTPPGDHDYYIDKVWLAPGGKYTKYLRAGDGQRLIVLDHGTGRRTDTTIDVPETQYDPDFTLAYRTPEADPEGMTLDLTLTTVQTGRKLRIYWVRGDQPQIVDSPANGQVLSRTYEEWEIQDPFYPDLKEALVTAVYNDIAESGDWDADRGATRWLDMPRPASS